MKITNLTNLPDPVVKALSKDNYSRGESQISVTTLIDCPRVRLLREEHDDDISEDVSEKLWSVLGTAVHNIFEETAEGEYISEERIFFDVNGWTVSGAIDIQKKEPDGSITIMDYKCTSVWSVIFGKEEWVEQLNAYAYLVRKAKDVSVGKLQIVAILRDWKKRDSQTKPDYPQSPIVIVDIPKWTETQQDNYFEQRVALHQEGEFAALMGDELPQCSNKERWMRDAKFVVKKKTVKRAIRIFDTKDQAEDFFNKEGFGDAYIIEERKSDPIRCSQNYCKVADFCDQYQKELINA